MILGCLQINDMLENEICIYYIELCTYSNVNI